MKKHIPAILTFCLVFALYGFMYIGGKPPSGCSTANDSVQVSYTGGSSSTDITGDTWVAQSWYLTTNATITGIELQLQDNNQTGSCTISVYTDTADGNEKPNTEVSGTAVTLGHASIPDGALTYVFFEFSSPIQPDRAKFYHVVARAIDGMSLKIGRRDGDFYYDGDYKYSTDGGSSWNVSARALNFRVYGCEGSGPSLVYTDDFSSDNITDIKNTIVVGSGVAKGGTDPGENYGYHGTTIGSSAQQVMADVKWDGGDDQTGGVIIRVNAGSPKTGYIIEPDANYAPNVRFDVMRFSDSTVTYINYLDFTDQSISVGSVYQIKAWVTSQNWIKIWCDFNDDGDFDDAGERCNNEIHDSTYTSGNYAGVFVERNSTDSTVDNLEAYGL